MNAFRIGFGEDAHRLEQGRALFIGDTEIIESPLGTLAHSDGDVLLHALSDALLSAFALGDIGRYFPPSDPEFAGLESRHILMQVLELLKTKAGDVAIINCAAVITLDRPKLGTYRDEIQNRVASLLDLSPACFGLGFKTSEGLAPDHIQARVSVLLELKEA